MPSEYRFSGHEGFPLRFAWIPKAIRHLNTNPKLFRDEEHAMAQLGIGKNMVRSLKFWLDTLGIVTFETNGAVIEDNSKLLFERLDPFLEDSNTLWWLHWRLCRARSPLFAWDFLINKWHSGEIRKHHVLARFKEESRKFAERDLSLVTLEQHYDIFLHTYVTPRSPRITKEEALDSPLTQLGFLQLDIDRRDEGGRSEEVYRFNVEAKPQLSTGLFAYCLDEFWRDTAPNDKTLAFREIAVGHNSPGQIFKMPEWEMRQRMLSLDLESRYFRFHESASIAHITRAGKRTKFSISMIHDQECTLV